MNDWIHRDGVAWDQVPLPHAHHRCWSQSWRKIDDTGFLVKCPCGAAGVKRFAEHVVWRGKNARRTDPINRKPYRRPRVVDLIRRILP